MSRPSSWQEIKTVLPWLPEYVWQRVLRHMPEVRPIHLIIGVADHFEPVVQARAPGEFADRNQRLKEWCRAYPSAVNSWRDNDGLPFRHTYFYPAEQYDESAIDLLAEHCHAGWGEIEIHLHHGIERADTAENTARVLAAFRDTLVARGCLSREKGTDAPRYAFVHGNWALANSDHGRFCGVDNEMQILAETGCYADFTLPAPSSAQISKINALYECTLPLNQRAPHRQGNDLQTGRAPRVFPLMIQGPLLVDFGRRKRGWLLPGIENSELSGVNPPTLRRLDLWRDAAIAVRGRPEWVFIKLHCHGLAPGEESVMFGPSIQRFLRDLVEGSRNGVEYKLHFVTLREMVNVILAACDGQNGNPGDYRDFRFQLFHPPKRS
ncbi:MAG: hypothetical protein WAK48_06960 [Candidatus Acidiferrum sp.]|jgi:hypothetical protein